MATTQDTSPISYKNDRLSPDVLNLGISIGLWIEDIMTYVHYFKMHGLITDELGGM